MADIKRISVQQAYAKTKATQPYCLRSETSEMPDAKSGRVISVATLHPAAFRCEDTEIIFY